MNSASAGGGLTENAPGRYNARMHIILFDIDGTLVHTGGAGKAALQDALSVEFQVDAAHEVPVHGHTDRGIARSLFRAHGLDDSQEHWDRFRTAYLRVLPDHLPRCTGRVLPGVTELLDLLSERDDVAVGLLTGNVQEGARIKLGYYGLMHHFRFGGFGDVHYERNDVAREALEVVRAFSNGRAAPERIWVIGDTPLDVSCARHIGARCVAVVTGNHTLEELTAAEPDLLLSDLSDPTSLLERIG